MSDFLIYHNPRCQKSRETLALLEAADIEPEVILYLDTPLSVDVLKKLAKKLAMRPIEFTRVKEPEFKALEVKVSDLSDEDVFKLLAAHPKLIERPIVVKGDRALLGRPPERVKNLL